MQNRNKSQTLLSSTNIGKHFVISATKTNLVLSELGWIERAIKGWQITKAGISLGGVQAKDKVSGIPYVRWPESILNNKILVGNINEVSGKVSSTQQNYNQVKSIEELDFRKKYPATYRTTDGHYVRSKGEMAIDNWLYYSKVIHAYERKLPIEEDLISDFYIPGGNVYIEYWGITNDPIYAKRKIKKLETYNKHHYQLIELTDKEIENLDDILPRRLLGYNIKTD